MIEGHLARAEVSAAEWPPPYRLAGDTWCLPGLARTRRLVEQVPGARPLSLLGWSPVVLQATRYHSAASTADPRREVEYDELALIAFERRPLALLPVALLVSHPLAKTIGDAYGFPKVVQEVRVAAGAWTLAASAGEGRRLTAARSLGAVLLTPLRVMLAHGRVGVHLPAARTRTTLAFEGVRRVAPVVGMGSPALRAWAGDAILLPLGVAVQGFRFTLTPPRPA